jgi:hypothetical protein
LLTFETNSSDHESENNPIKIKPNKINKAKVKKKNRQGGGWGQLKIKEKKLNKPKQTWLNFLNSQLVKSWTQVESRNLIFNQFNFKWLNYKKENINLKNLQK